MAQGIDELASLSASFRERVKSELVDEIDEVTVASFLIDNFLDLLSDELNLSLLGIRALSDLTILSTSETDEEQSEDITILSLDFDMGLNERLPFLKIRAELISGHIKTMEVSQTGSTLDFFNAKLDFSPNEYKGNTINT